MPQYRRLALGHTRAVVLLMETNRQAVRRAALAFPSWGMILLNDGSALTACCVPGHRCLAVYMHVDDFGCLCVEQVRFKFERLAFFVKYYACAMVKTYIGFQLRS